MHMVVPGTRVSLTPEPAARDLTRRLEPQPLSGGAGARGEKSFWFVSRSLDVLSPIPRAFSNAYPHHQQPTH